MPLLVLVASLFIVIELLCTVTGQPLTNVTIVAAGQTIISSNSPGNNNAQEFIAVIRNLSPDIEGQCLLQFDLQLLQNPLITNVELYIERNAQYVSSPNNVTFRFDWLDPNNWNVKTITWNNQDTISSFGSDNLTFQRAPWIGANFSYVTLPLNRISYSLNWFSYQVSLKISAFPGMRPFYLNTINAVTETKSPFLMIEYEDTCPDNTGFYYDEASDQSECVPVTTPPQRVSVAYSNDNTATITWDAVTGADFYQIKNSTDNVTFFVSPGADQFSSYQTPTLPLNTTIYIRVYSGNEFGLSKTFTDETLLILPPTPLNLILIIGIVLGCVVVVLLITALLFWYKNRNKSLRGKYLKERLLHGGFELDDQDASLFTDTTSFGNGISRPETTLLNTKVEIVVPAFLILDYETQLQIGDPISGGGFATIYSGRFTDPLLEKKYQVTEIAVKVFKNDPRFSGEENEQNYQQEVAIMWSLNALANVIPLLGFANNPKSLVTKLYKTDLFQFIHTPSIPITPKMALHLALDISSAMAAIHFSGVVHRDLKSPNILLEAGVEGGKTSMKAVICDFGLARIVHGKRVIKNYVNLEGISPRYTAPEVFSRMKSKEVATGEEEKKSDIFSFAIIVWELLTRKKPWANCATIEEIESNVSQGKREELPQAFGNDYLEKLIQVVQQSWLQNPDERPSFQKIKAFLQLE